MPSKTYKAAVKALTTNIKRRRRELGLTQEDTAERLQIATRHFQKLEAGDLNLTLRTLCKMADVLQTTPHELLRRD